MKCRSEKKLSFASPGWKAFTLPEVMGALVILALVSSSVVVVINRCMASAADMELRIQAFELARQNIEKLLTSDAVKEMVEYGTSYEYPDIQWQNVVETFYEPVTSKMWIRAVCSAEYYDTEGELQTVELTHWLSGLTEKQVSQVLEQRQRQKDRLAESGELFATIEEAAEYARVDVETIEQWVENGMFVTEDGGLPRVYLDLYFEYDGYPPAEAAQEATQTFAMLSGKTVTAVESPLGESTDLLLKELAKLLEDPDQMTQPTPEGTEQGKPTEPSDTAQDKPSQPLPPGIDWDKIPPELRPLVKKLLEQ